MARPNGKSVRLSNEALKIINESPGEGFNDKFEKLVLDYYKTIPARQAELTAIETKIKTKKKELETLQAQELRVRSMIIDLDVIANLIPRIAKSLSSVSQEINPEQPAAQEIEIQNEKIHPDAQRFNAAFKNFGVR